VLRLRGRLNSCCALDCACRGPGIMDIPVPTYYYLGGVSWSPRSAITHATACRVAWKGLVFTPIGIPLSRADWGCLKGTIWTTRRWGRREQGSCHVPDPYPGSMPAFPTQGSNIARSVGGADYNYKSLAAVAHTPGWNGTLWRKTGG